MPPFQYSPFVNPYAASIGDLLMRRGDIEARRAVDIANAQARAAEAKGQIWGGVVSNIANVAGRAFETHAQEQREAPQRAMQAEMDRLKLGEARAASDERAQMTRQEASLRGLFEKYGAQNALPPEREIVSVMGPQKGLALVQGLSALQALKQKQFGDSKTVVRDLMLGMHALPENLRAELYPSVRQDAIAAGALTEQDAPPDYDPAWWKQAVSYGKEPAKPQGLMNVPPGGAVLDPDTRQPVFTNQDPRADETARHNKEMERISRLTAGRTQAAADETARHNRAMEENARNAKTGRPVTSGDAGRIAELDTSLDDVAVLRGAVSGNKATGTTALLGSKVPNWVTEITGWGTDAKSKNAVIARVKQVIGKALEGGVLRKEDEVKYKDILPTIGDVPEVVMVKIDGLEKAIAQRRQRELDAREDAGYDVSKFRARTPKDAGGKADPLGIR